MWSNCHVCMYVLSFSFFIRCCRHRRDKRAVFFLLNYFLFLICCCRQQRTILFFFSYIVFLYSLFVVARIGMTRERWWKPEALPLYRCTRQDAPQRGLGGTKYYNHTEHQKRCTEMQPMQTDSHTWDVLDKIH